MLIHRLSSALSNLAKLSLAKRSWLLAIGGWTAFFVYSVAHCVLYLSYVKQSPSGVWESFLWAMTEYAIWPAVTAFLFIALSQYWQRKRIIAMAGLCLLAYLVTLSARVLLDFALNPNAVLGSSVVYFGSEHLTIIVMVTLIWALIMRPLDELHGSPLKPNPPVQPKEDAPALLSSAGETLDTLTVNTGTREITVPIANIDSVTASGNYMDITCGAHNYVLRSTLKELEGRLTGHGFARVHRSHLVNLEAVTQIDNNQQVVLRNGQRLSIGQRYLKNFVNYQSITNSVTLSL